MSVAGSPPTPSPYARARILAAFVAVGLLAAACSGERPELVQPVTDSTLAPIETTVPLPERSECVTTTGPGPARAIIALAPALDDDPTGTDEEVGADGVPADDPATAAVPCVVVAAHHRVELTNPGPAAVDVAVGSTALSLPPGESRVTEPSGVLFTPGPNRVLAGEATVATVWLVDPAEDPLAGTTIDLTSIGEVVLGLEPAEVTAAAGGIPVPAAGSACYLSSLDGDPYSPLFTFRNGQLVVVQVFTPGPTTLSGISIGSSSADVLAAYGDRVESRPGPDGDPARQLLVFLPTDEKDQVFRLVFDLLGDRVTTMRFGATEIVADQPGCGS